MIFFWSFPLFIIRTDGFYYFRWVPEDLVRSSWIIASFKTYFLSSESTGGFKAPFDFYSTSILVINDVSPVSLFYLCFFYFFSRDYTSNSRFDEIFLFFESSCSGTAFLGSEDSTTCYYSIFPCSSLILVEFFLVFFVWLLSDDS